MPARRPLPASDFIGRYEAIEPGFAQYCRARLKAHAIGKASNAEPINSSGGRTFDGGRLFARNANPQGARECTKDEIKGAPAGSRQRQEAVGR